jgi:hypothetical protein
LVGACDVAACCEFSERFDESQSVKLGLKITPERAMH